MSGPPAPSLAAVARTMAVDAWTAEAVTALRDAGVPALLLKGPAIAAWLHAGEHRPYGDADLLVAPADQDRAQTVLARLGYVEHANPPQPGAVIEHATPWLRAADGAAIDLHRTLSGAAADPAAVFRTLAAHAEHLDLGGVRVAVPQRAAVALIVALHAAQHGPEVPGPLDDLRRAVALGDDALWRAGARLAGALVAAPQMGAGLRLVPGGAALADRLGLPSADLLDGAPTVLGLERLAAARGLRERARIVREEVVPPPGFLRWWRPWAGRSRAALAVAYVYRVLWLVAHLPRGVVEWRARRARGSGR